MRKTDRKFAVIKQKEENRLLAIETNEIEERLKLLKSTLYSKLSTTCKPNPSEPIWGSSHLLSTVNRQKVDALHDISKLKFKTLKHSSASKSKTPDAYSNTIGKHSDSVKCTFTISADIQQPKCGQCEDKKAVVSCQECSEYYCAKCFATFHLKGALKRHHSLPISGCQSSHNITIKSNLGLQTEAVEDISQYHCSNKTSAMMQSSEIVNHDVSTLCNTSTPVEIYFTPSITYAEKLLLRLHRNSILQKPTKQDNVDNQLIFKDIISTHSNIDGKNEEEITENFAFNRISFDELHKLATTKIQLNNNGPNTIVIYSNEDFEQSILQSNNIISSTSSQFNKNYLEIPLTDITLYNVSTKTENTGQARAEQCFKLGDEDNFVEKIQETNDIFGLLSNQQNMWQPIQSIIKSNYNINPQISKTINEHLNIVSNKQLSNATDLRNSFCDEFKRKAKSPVQSQRIILTEIPYLSNRQAEALQFSDEEQDDDDKFEDNSNNHNYLYDSLG
ncbi:Zinc finger B-box domain-containing protein [Schistosoma japonicum]|nr:Zinc finger B-box domain-containing protein [Schistosoma japonicum]KAH8852459.1 Zinc finger B-box domain-containing protein [Schistosoma japonicum]